MRALNIGLSYKLLPCAERLIRADKRSVRDSTATIITATARGAAQLNL